MVARASGRSTLKSLVAPLILAILIGALAVAAINPIIAATQRHYEAFASRLTGQGTSIVSVSREGLWLRQGSDSGQTVIRAERSNLDGTELGLVTFYGFDLDGRATYRIEAETARLEELGAKRIAFVRNWQVMEAPSGHRFCIVRAQRPGFEREANEWG